MASQTFRIGDQVTVINGDFAGASGAITHIHPATDTFGEDLIRVKTIENPPGNIVVRPAQIRLSIIQN